MKPRDYFPLGKAIGPAFCNREKETAWLLENIKAHKHSLLIAPRRFGKSSLAETVIQKSGLPACLLNFNICTDEQEVAEVIRQGVSQLIATALGPVDKIIHSIKNYVTHLTPTLSFGSHYARLELVSQPHSTKATQVEEAFLLIERLLQEKKKSAVMVLDEFQMVGLIAKGTGVEAAIRNVAQTMKHITLIFSGSSRHLLRSMFEDEGRPLYKLCRKLTLERIAATHYQKHCNKAARLQWQKPLDPAVFEQIMHYSQQHPYYVNYLCDVLWTDCKNSPTVDDVQRAFLQVCAEEESDAQAEIAHLSMGQKKIMRYIANHQGHNLLSAQVVKATGMPLSSIASALTGLLEKDLLEKQQNVYRIINPMINYLLQHT